MRSSPQAALDFSDEQSAERQGRLIQALPQEWVPQIDVSMELQLPSTTIEKNPLQIRVLIILRQAPAPTGDADSSGLTATDAAVTDTLETAVGTIVHNVLEVVVKSTRRKRLNVTRFYDVWRREIH